jgi:hypothetical protein
MLKQPAWLERLEGRATQDGHVTQSRKDRKENDLLEK